MNGLLKFITCGSVDDGKSTLIGHILYDTKLLYTDQKKALELDSKVGSRGGELDYSLLLDGLMAEREQGITIDVAYRYFTTKRRSFIVADTPGHEQYTRNMAVGASFADFAVILVDATQGVLMQTKRHARICALMGIHYFAFAVNKMDLVSYDEARFKEILSQIDALKTELSLYDVRVFPVSATEGDNITKPSENMPWYTGGDLLSYLETVEIDKEKEEGFYMPVQRVCRPDRSFRGFQGQIESGKIRVGDEVNILPAGEKAGVKGIFIGDKEAEEASEGSPVTISLDKEVDVSRGCVIVKGAEPKTAKAFTAKMLWMDDNPLQVGGDYIFKIGTKQMPGVLKAIRHKVDVNTGEYLKADTLGKNELALVDALLQEEVTIDIFDAHKTLGEFILIDRLTNMTSACGVITEVTGRDGYEGSAVFADGDAKVCADIYDKYYYDSLTKNIKRVPGEPVIYKPGDTVLLKGEGYEYPEDMDIVFEDRAVRIRGGIFEGLTADKAGDVCISPEGFALADKKRIFEAYRRIIVK